MKHFCDRSGKVGNILGQSSEDRVLTKERRNKKRTQKLA
jgi:hypothetical protein